MKKFIFLLLLCISTIIQAQNNIKTYDEFFVAGMHKTAGIFPVYIADKEIYLEIPAQYDGREINITAQIDRGFDLINRPAKSKSVVRIDMSTDGVVYFQQPFYTERVLDPKSQFHRAFSLSNVQPKGEEHPIIAYSNEGGAIIRITDYILNESKWFSYSYQFIRSLIPSLTEIISVNAGEESIALTIRRYHEAEGERYMSSSSNVIMPFGSMPLDVTCDLRLLPSKEDRIRLADHRVPYQTLRFKDYTQDPYNIVEDSLILRWDFYRPLTFYVDTLFPKEYFNAVKKGVLIWNKALQKAGIRNPLRVKYADKDIIAGTERAFISYDLQLPGVKGDIAYHPRTGEILSCRINIGHGAMKEALSDYLLTCGTLDKRIEKNPHAPEVEHELLRSEITRTAGRLLGLSQTMSIQPCGKPLELSDTDYAFIYFGYHEFGKQSDCYADRERLIKWIDKLPAQSLLHTENNQPKWQNVSDTDYSNRIEVLQTVVNRLERYAIHENGKTNAKELTDLYKKAFSIYGKYLQSIAEQIGNTNYSAMTQHQAMIQLNQYLFRSKKLMNNSYINENLLVNRNSLLFTEVKTLFTHLLNEQVITHLQKQGLKIDHGYDEDRFWEDLEEGLFNSFDPSVEMTKDQMNIQLLCIDVWKKSIAESTENSSAKKILVTKLHELKEKLNELSKTHTQGQARQMCKLLILRIENSNWQNNHP